MSATLNTAMDEALALFRAAWLAGGASADLPVLYEETPTDPPTSGDWCRVSVQHQEGGQTSLAGADATRRYTYLGDVTVEIFTEHGKGRTASNALVLIAMNAFRGKRTAAGVVFYNVRPIEVGRDGVWYKVNVVASFEYDEVA